MQNNSKTFSRSVACVAPCCRLLRVVVFLCSLHIIECLQRKNKANTWIAACSQMGLTETQSTLKRALTTVQRTLQSLDSAHALKHRADSPQTDGSQWQRFCLFQRVRVLTQKGSSDGATTHQLLNYRLFVQIKDYKERDIWNWHSDTMYEIWSNWLHLWKQIWSGFVLSPITSYQYILCGSKQVLGQTAWLELSFKDQFFKSIHSRWSDCRSDVSKHNVRSMYDFCVCGWDL